MSMPNAINTFFIFYFFFKKGGGPCQNHFKLACPEAMYHYQLKHFSKCNTNVALTWLFDWPYECYAKSDFKAASMKEQ